MARGLGTLVVDLLLKTGSFESDMGRASKTAQKRMKEIERAANTAGKVIGTALVAGAGLAAVAIKSAIDQADQLNEISQKIGIPTDVLSGLNYAAKLAGVATEELQGGLVKLVKFQADAAKGGKESSRVFETLGIAIKDANGNLRDSNEVFKDFAEFFSRLPDGAQKTALAVQVFGKSGAELIPLLNEGRAGLAAYSKELDELGGTVTPATARAADEFNDNLDKLKVAFGGIALQAAEAMLPALIDVTNQMVAFSKDGSAVKVIAEDIGTAFKYAAQFINDAARSYRVFRETWEKEGLFADNFFGSESGFLARETAAIKADEDRAKQREAMLAVGLGQSGRYSGGSASGRGAGAGRKDGRADRAAAKAASLFTPIPEGAGRAKVDEVAQAYERMNAQMAETIALFGETSEVARVRYELEHGELAKLSQEKKDVLLAQAAEIDALKQRAKVKEEADRQAKEEAEALERHNRAVKELIDDIQFETMLTGLSNEEKEKAIALRRVNADAATAEGQAILASIDALQQARKKNEELISNMDEFRQSFSDNVADVLTGTKSIADAFRSLADQIIAQLARMMANRLTESLFGSMGSPGGGSLGGLLGGLFGGGSSGSASSIASGAIGGIGLLPGFANGTNYAPGGWAMVGERGPELVNLPRGSKVFPNGTGPASRSLSITINPPAGMSRQSADQFAQDVAHRIQRVTARTD